MKEQIYVATFSENAIDVIREYGFNIELNDLCISENLDPEKVRSTMAEMEREITESGAEKAIIHGPFTEIIPASIDHRAVELGLNRLNEDHAVVENVFEDEPLMMKELVEELDDPRIQICLDVGHANAVTCEDYDIHDWVRILGPLIGHFHLHNNDGKDDLHGPLESGTMDMAKILASIRNHCRPDVTMTIESRTCASSAEWICRQLKMDNVDKL